MLKHKFDATQNKNVKIYDLEAHQTRSDVIVSDWSCHQTTFGERFECRVSLTLDKNGKPMVEIDTIKGYMTRSKEMCLLIYNAYYKFKYAREDVRFSVRMHKDEEMIEGIEIAYSED